MTTITTPARAAGPAGFDAAEWLEEHAAGDIVMTPEGRVTAANRPARRILRLPAGRDARGLDFRTFCRQPARFAETIEAIRTAGYVSSWDADLVAIDGGPVHAVVNLVGEFEDGGLAAVRAQLFDVSEWRRRLERTLFGQRIEESSAGIGDFAHFLAGANDFGFGQDFPDLFALDALRVECAALTPLGSKARVDVGEGLLGGLVHHLHEVAGRLLFGGVGRVPHHIH